MNLFRRFAATSHFRESAVTEVYSEIHQPFTNLRETPNHIRREKS